MCDEKSIIISVLRALLISKGKNGPVRLSELKRDFYLQEGRREIPIFEYKNVGDFLHSSGEFIVNVLNGDVMVREKPKLESLHIKKFVMEQKSGKRTSYIHLRNDTHQKINTVHSAKPSVTFTFDDLRDSLRTNNMNSLEEASLDWDLQDEIESQRSQPDRITPVSEEKSTNPFFFDMLNNQDSWNNDIAELNSLGKTSFDWDLQDETLDCDLQDEIESQPDRIITHVPEEKSNNSLCFDTSKNEKQKSVCDVSTMTVDCEQETDVGPRLRLLETILKFHVDKDCGGEYCATTSVNKKKYYGYGSSLDVAKSDALNNVLNCTKQKSEEEVTFKHSTADDDESSTSSNNDCAFHLLNQMTNALQYHCHKVDGFYLSSITVEGREFNALGVSEASAKNRVATKVLADKEVMTLLKIWNTNDWQFLGIVNGLHRVAVKIDEIVYDGQGNNPQNAVANCIENAMKIKPGTSSDTNQATSIFKILHEKCVGLRYLNVSSGSDDKFKVMLQLHAVDYYGEGSNIGEANENAANECLKSVLNGDHYKAIEIRRTQDISRLNALMSRSLLQSNQLYPQQNFNHFNNNVNINATRALLLQQFQYAQYYSSLYSGFK